MPKKRKRKSKKKSTPGKKEKESELPDEFILMENPEKKFHEKWFPKRNKLNFPHPFRMLLTSIQPNLGKTAWIKNILARIRPKFKKIYLLHCGGGSQIEYDKKLIDFTILEKLPPINSEVFNPMVKTLLIIEDKNFNYFSKTDLHTIDRYYGFISTHKNLSIICSSQSFFDVPVPIRQMSNIYVLWKNRDLDSMKAIGRKVGLTKDELQFLIKKYLVKIYDTLWIDMTKGSPYPLRKNGFIPIEI